jgi:CRISPR-associated protein Csd2
MEMQMSNVIQNRYDIVYFFDVKNGNPNGDPDGGNMPRTHAESNLGIVTDVCQKRKLRNYVLQAMQDKPGYDIYVAENSILSEQNARAFEKLGINPSKKNASEKGDELRKAMCELFWDVRTFGAVMVGNESFNLKKLQGPVQTTFAESLFEIVPEHVTISRMAKTNKDEDGDANQTFGNKYIVPYALYQSHIFINPKLAEKTGFSEDDLEVLFDGLKNMFDLDRSSSRGLMSCRGIKVFKHDNKLGRASAGNLFDRVRVDCSKVTPTSFNDYTIAVDDVDLPKGVSYIDM